MQPLSIRRANCDGLIAPFQHETEDELQAVGRCNPAACDSSSKVPQRQ